MKEKIYFPYTRVRSIIIKKDLSIYVSAFIGTFFQDKSFLIYLSIISEIKDFSILFH